MCCNETSGTYQEENEDLIEWAKSLPALVRPVNKKQEESWRKFVDEHRRKRLAGK